jgi:hypothetical protein
MPHTEIPLMALLNTAASFCFVIKEKGYKDTYVNNTKEIIKSHNKKFYPNGFKLHTGCLPYEKIQHVFSIVRSPRIYNSDLGLTPEYRPIEKIVVIKLIRACYKCLVTGDTDTFIAKLLDISELL